MSTQRDALQLPILKQQKNLDVDLKHLYFIPVRTSVDFLMHTLCSPHCVLFRESDQNPGEKEPTKRVSSTIQVPVASYVDAMQIYEHVKGRLKSAKRTLKSHEGIVTCTSYEVNIAQFEVEFYCHVKCVLADMVISKDVIDRIQTWMSQFESAVANFEQPENDEVDVRFYGKCCENIIAEVKQVLEPFECPYSRCNKEFKQE